MTRRFASIALAVLLLLPLAARADDAKIRELFDLTGGRQMGRQMSSVFVQQAITGLRKSSPEVTDAQAAEVAKIVAEVFDSNYPTLLDSLVPLYEKHFTPAEIDELIGFYSSPTGKKATAAMPVIFQELQPALMAWATKVQPEVQKKVAAALAAKPAQ